MNTPQVQRNITSVRKKLKEAKAFYADTTITGRTTCAKDIFEMIKILADTVEHLAELKPQPPEPMVYMCPACNGNRRAINYRKNEIEECQTCDGSGIVRSKP